MVSPRGGGAKSGGALPKSHTLCPKTAFFGQKRPRNPDQTAKQRQTGATFHVHLHCPVLKSPFLPSTSTICPRNGPKMAKNGLNVRFLCQTRPKPRTGPILGYVAQNQIPRAPVHPQSPTFCGCQASERPTKTPRSPYHSSLGGAGWQHSPRTVGASGGSAVVPRVKKCFFQNCS